MPETTDLFQYTGRELEAMDFARNYHRWILDLFRPYLGGTVAEVGAGTGSFSDLLLETGLDRLYAIEPSVNLYPHLERHFGGSGRVVTQQGYFGDAAPTLAGALDAVVYVNVMEHVPDDRAEFRLVYDALKPGGHVCVFVPALPWLYSDFDEMLGHFRRYTRASLVSTVEQAGLRVKQVRYFDVAGILPWYVAFVLLKRRLGAGQVTWYDKLVVPVMRRIETLVTPPIGKNLLLVAARP